MEASGCPVLRKEDRACLRLSWDTSHFGKQQAEDPALLQASASGQISCILFSPLYPHLSEQMKTSPETGPQFGGWLLKSLWKWASLDRGLGVTLAEGGSLSVPRQGAVSSGQERSRGGGCGVQGSPLAWSHPGQPRVLLRQCLHLQTRTSANPRHCAGIGAGTSAASAVSRASCHGPAGGPSPRRGCGTLWGALPRGGQGR